MAGHVPFVTAVKQGACTLVGAEGERREGTIEEGILTVDAEKVTVLTSGLQWRE